MGGPAGTSGIRIEIDEKSMGRLTKALRILGETGAPFLRAAMQDVGERFADEIRHRSPGGIGGHVQMKGVLGKGGALRASGVVKHPGARSMEFGRKWYWTGYRGRAQRTGRKTPHTPGQAARPYLGVIKGDAATAAITPYAREHILEAIDREWDRIGEGGD